MCEETADVTTPHIANKFGPVKPNGISLITDNTLVKKHSQTVQNTKKRK